MPAHDLGAQRARVQSASIALDRAQVRVEAELARAGETGPARAGGRRDRWCPTSARRRHPAGRRRTPSGSHVASVMAVPWRSIEAPPTRCSSNVEVIGDRPSAVAATTAISGPIPSPGSWARRGGSPSARLDGRARGDRGRRGGDHGLSLGPAPDHRVGEGDSVAGDATRVVTVKPSVMAMIRREHRREDRRDAVDAPGPGDAPRVEGGEAAEADGHGHAEGERRRRDQDDADAHPGREGQVDQSAAGAAAARTPRPRCSPHAMAEVDDEGPPGSAPRATRCEPDAGEQIRSANSTTDNAYVGKPRNSTNRWTSDDLEQQEADADGGEVRAATARAVARRGDEQQRQHEREHRRAGSAGSPASREQRRTGRRV